MTPRELLADLQAKGIHLATPAGRLVVDAPAGALTPELRAQLAALKPGILALLLEEKIATYRQALALNPAGAALRNNLGCALYDAGRLEEAAAEFRKAADAGRSDARDNLTLALSHLQQEGAAA